MEEHHAQDEEIKNIKLSFSSPDLWNLIKSPNLDDTNNINNTSSANVNYQYRCDDVPSPLGSLPKKGKDPSKSNKQRIDDVVIDTPDFELPTPCINTNNNNITSRMSHPRACSSSNTVITELPHTDAHVVTPMQDIILLEPINISTNCNNDSDQSPTVASDYPSNVSILMDTSSINDTLIKKTNNKKKKKLKQDLETEMVAPIEVVQPHVLTDLLIDVSEHDIAPQIH
ncbi:hypothetical protein C1645_813148 [Glomus cerebriforme]|uniref:Uncharacterized protein n=1 Tax=Glomus cerebriforme TaxID=658196 RepID=A0A397TSP2_9GLOM|nr:hypothetical protein C1645_813148 [Glomus cerebriforme]